MKIPSVGTMPQGKFDNEKWLDRGKTSVNSSKLPSCPMVGTQSSPKPLRVSLGVSQKPSQEGVPARLQENPQHSGNQGGAQTTGKPRAMRGQTTGAQRRHQLKTPWWSWLPLDFSSPSSAPLSQRSEQFQKTVQSKNPIPTPPAKVTQATTPNVPTRTLKRHHGWGKEESVYRKKISINL